MPSFRSYLILSATSPRCAENFLAGTPSSNSTSISENVNPFVSGMRKYAHMRQSIAKPAQKKPVFALSSSQ